LVTKFETFILHTAAEALSLHLSTHYHGSGFPFEGCLYEVKTM